MLCDVLTKYEFVFDVTLGTWKIKPIYTELQKGEKPDHAKAYSVARSHEDILSKEVEQFCIQSGATPRSFDPKIL